jgi:16S rRNA (guanine966-N2)-methyltransferase
MRIVGGEHRGRRLFTPGGETTRPTAEKVREALFDILGARVRGAAFGDLYAGTGAVGLEALSRGAASCLFVERGRDALGALEKNLDLLGVRGASRVLAMEAAHALDLVAREGTALDLLFCDPPYADPHWSELLAGMGARGILARGGLLVVEHAVKGPPPCPGGFGQGRSYRYGDTGLTVFLRRDAFER